MIKLLVVFSLEAHSHVDEHGYGVTKLKKNKELTKGRDWDIREFKTKAELEAYKIGLEDGNGWVDEADYEVIK